MEPKPFDVSPLEQTAPIWLLENVCVCLGEVSPPSEAVCFRLKSPSYFGTGAHPFTRSLILALNDMQLQRLTILDYKSGSGLLGIYCATFGAEVISHNQQEIAAITAVQNAIENGVICHPAQDSTLNKEYHGHFDLVISQQIEPHSARKDIQLMNKLLSAYGSILISGWRPKNQRFIRGIVEEFFKISAVDDLNGTPILMAEKNED